MKFIVASRLFMLILLLPMGILVLFGINHNALIMILAHAFSKLFIIRSQSVAHPFRASSQNVCGNVDSTIYAADDLTRNAIICFFLSSNS